MLLDVHDVITICKQARVHACKMQRHDTAAQCSPPHMMVCSPWQAQVCPVQVPDAWRLSASRAVGTVHSDYAGWFQAVLKMSTAPLPCSADQLAREWSTVLRLIIAPHPGAMTGTKPGRQSLNFTSAQSLPTQLVFQAKPLCEAWLCSGRV